jgi:hypothetical protein
MPSLTSNLFGHTVVGGQFYRSNNLIIYNNIIAQFYKLFLGLDNLYFSHNTTRSEFIEGLGLLTASGQNGWGN